MKKILVIDDDPLIGKMLVVKIEQESIKRSIPVQVSRALDGREGLDAIYRDTPDLVILDIMMPRLSGLDVLKELQSKGLTNRFHILAVSNLGDPETQKQVTFAGVKSYFVKANTSTGEIIRYVFEHL